jgi:hypothetical protein
VLDVYVNAVEFTCYQLYLETEATPDDVTQARSVMLRMALATLGSPDDWQFLVENPTFFDRPAAPEPPPSRPPATPSHPRRAASRAEGS